MSTAVMTNGSIYEFSELLLKQQQQNAMGGQTVPSGAGSPTGAKGLRWERAVGLPLDGHEPLSRRASHPVGPSMGSLITSLLLENINSHRRLDRSQSDPAKTIVNVNTSRYKTELCRPFEENGECKYGDKCQFAHGGHELRNLVRHPKYKTELCRTFHTSGFCPYGPRCHFIHNAEEARANAMKNRPRPLCLIPGPGSSAETPSPPSSLGSASPPPSTTSNTAFSFASLVHSLESPGSLSPCQSPPPPPGSPDARLPVFNRISTHNPGILAFQFGSELRV
ncbi:protein TIS11-like isoform X1 [Macrosteles quadrilineatus]|uniref:protein TIS11-like isoform X1 n=1 Tax=Macrosteles quadrilineatus TaxID=74068 RepID=UPI0023E28395|nr:protein TIS11-like isoform X1 [Macrosteles quadrilineatus]